MKKTAVFICIASFVLFLAGCGAGEESKVKDVVNSYHQAIIDQDVDKVMSLSVPEEDRSQVEAIIGFRSEGMQRAGGLPEINNVEITGNTAVVRCQFGPAEQDINLRKVDGKWLMDVPGH